MSSSIPKTTNSLVNSAIADFIHSWPTEPTDYWNKILNIRRIIFDNIRNDKIEEFLCLLERLTCERLLRKHRSSEVTTRQAIFKASSQDLCKAFLMYNNVWNDEYE